MVHFELPKTGLFLTPFFHFFTKHGDFVTKFQKNKKFLDFSKNRCAKKSLFCKKIRTLHFLFLQKKNFRKKIRGRISSFFLKKLKNIVKKSKSRKNAKNALFWRKKKFQKNSILKISGKIAIIYALFGTDLFRPGKK